MGGGLIRNEPTVHDVLMQDAPCKAEFKNYVWLDYLLKINGFNEDFALEFSQTLSEGKTMVKGLEVIATEERIG